MNTKELEEQRQVLRVLDDAEAPLGQETGMLDPDRTRETRTPAFSRMRLEWGTRDAQMMTSIDRTIQRLLFDHFPMAYELMHRLFDVIREPMMDERGEVALDEYGWTVWKTTSTGAYVEDWSRLTYAVREQLLYQITAYMFEWEQQAAKLWGDSMFAKAQWEERFAGGFTASSGKTVDDRTQSGRLASQEERYFAIFQAVLSRRAEALVRSMQLLNQRIKDTTT